MQYWEIVADNLKKRGWTYGYVSTVDSQGRNDLDCRRVSRGSAAQV